MPRRDEKDVAAGQEAEVGSEISEATARETKMSVTLTAPGCGTVPNREVRRDVTGNAITWTMNWSPVHSRRVRNRDPANWAPAASNLESLDLHDVVWGMPPKVEHLVGPPAHTNFNRERPLGACLPFRHMHEVRKRWTLKDRTGAETGGGGGCQ